jgi:hypothetical protein
VLEYFIEVEPQWRFLDRWMVITGFCQRQFRQTNEHQHYLNKKLNSELHGEEEFIKTSFKKYFFLPPSRNEILSLTLGSRLSYLLSVNMTYRVLLLQGGKIFCLTVNKKNIVCKKKKKISITNRSLFHYTGSHFGRNNKKMGHLEIFCLCFLFCQHVLHSRGPVIE